MADENSKPTTDNDTRAILGQRVVPYPQPASASDISDRIIKLRFALYQIAKCNDLTHMTHIRTIALHALTEDNKI